MDKEGIDRLENAALHINPPVKRGAAIRVEEPWEVGRVRASSIITWDEKHRLYYRVQPTAGGGPFWGFLESQDGVTWERPDLEAAEFQGSMSNNLIDFDGQEPNETCFFVDPTGPDEHRIKAICHRQYEGGMYLVTSPDGIHFKRAPGHLINLIADNHMSAFYDERVGKYRVYLRGWDIRRPWPPIKGSRMLSLAETADLFVPLPFDPDAPDQWPLAPKFQTPEFQHYGLRKIHLEFPPVIRPDDIDPPSAGIYQGAVVHYMPSTYLAFPTIYFRHPGPPDGFVNDGILDIQFAFSQDGVTWDRMDRLPYVRLDLPDGPGTKFLHMLTGVIPDGHRIWQYYVAERRSHGAGRLSGQDKPTTPTTVGDPIVCLLEQRKDGFASIDTGYEGGSVTTKAFELTTDRIALNIDTSASGEARVALLDTANKAIPGFELGSFDRYQGNDTAAVLSWKGISDVSRLRGRMIRLHIAGRATKLYSIVV